MRLSIAEQVIDLALEVGCRLGRAVNGGMVMFRPDVPFSYARTADANPYRYQDDPEAERAALPAYKSANEQFDAQCEAHAPLSVAQRESRHA